MEDHAFRFDLIVRPHQVNSTEELRWMKRIANRTVVAQLDFISFSNPTYFGSDHGWLSQRELTKLVHATVDGIAWISEYARSDAHRNGVRRLASNDAVIFCGTDSESTNAIAACPAELVGVSEPILTVLGVGYNHKNRLFALRVLEELRVRDANCHLVLAGPNPPFGSSIAEEEEFLSSRPALQDRVTFLPALSDAEREWLYAESAVILYPTVSEGFGLVPFEAARAGTPTLSTRMGSLDEVLPAGIPTIDSFDVNTTATLVQRILSEPDLSSTIVRDLCERGDHYTWDRTGTLMLELLDRVLIGPRNNVDGVWAEAPTAAAIHSSDYVARLLASHKRAARFRRITSIGVGRMVVGPPGSRRRRLAKTLYRRLGR
jgi:glycosyltransferase involved in cell wall biosynthesis